MDNKSKQKWVHIIGIAGVTTSALAIEFKNNGWKVTGSDQHIYSPSDVLLEKNNIEFFTNFHFSNLIEDYENYRDSKSAIEKGRNPDLVVMASPKPGSTKELKFAQKHNLEIKTYPEVLNSKIVVTGNSIVVAGTFGKTSITSMLTYGLMQVFDVSYMFGGYVDNFEKTLKFKNKNTKFSVIEGDEYITSKYLDPKSKFFHYDPNILILNSIEWDHTDVFRNKKEYLDNFIELVKSVPDDGKIYYKDTKNIIEVINHAKCKLIELHPERYLERIENYNQENLGTVIQVLTDIVEEDKLYTLKSDLIENFSGIKRRFEIRYKDDKLAIIDDFGSSPPKAKGTIDTIKKNFPNHKIIIIYEPNEGARTQESLELYDGIFSEIDFLIIPKFRNIVNRIDEKKLYDYLKKDLKDNIILENDNLESILEKIIKDKNKYVVAFLGSHNFEDKILKSINYFREYTLS